MVGLSLHSNHRVFGVVIHVKSRHLDFVSYSNHMQYLKDVSEGWPCSKMVLEAMYNMKLALSSSIFKCRFNSFPLLSRRINEKAVPPLFKVKKNNQNNPKNIHK